MEWLKFADSATPGLDSHSQIYWVIKALEMCSLYSNSNLCV